MASASFTINSVSSPVEVAAGTPMTCTLSSVNGVRPGVAWSFIGKSDSDVAYPAITLSGTPYGSTASFTMPTPADLNAGFSLVLQCVINGGKDDNRQTVAGYTATGLCGVINARALLPWAFGETTERGSIGIADDYNAQMATTGGAATTTSQINSQRVPWKATARFAITSNVSNLASFTVAASEGTAVAGDRLLLTGQTTGSQNGLYVVGTVGGGTAPLTRASDMAASADCLPGSQVAVSEGATYANSTWVLVTAAPITLGSTSLLFIKEQKSYSLDQFGAVGNDSTVCNTAWSQAATAVQATGGELFIPQGTFKLTASASIVSTSAKPVKIRGLGPSSILKFYSVQDGLTSASPDSLEITNLQITGSAARCISLTGTSTKCRLVDLIVNGATVTPTSGALAGIYFAHTIDCEIDGALVSGCGLTPAPKNVTFANASDTWTGTAHGYTNGMVVQIGNSGGVLPTGYAFNTNYYVVNAATDTFKLSLTLGGSAVDGSDDGTGTHRVSLATGNYGIVVNAHASGNTIKMRRLNVATSCVIQVIVFDPLRGSSVDDFVINGGGSGVGGGYNDGYGVAGYAFIGSSEIHIGKGKISSCAGPGVYCAGLAAGEIGPNLVIESTNLFKNVTTLPGGGVAATSGNGLNIKGVTVRSSGDSSFSLTGNNNTMRGCTSYTPTTYALYLRGMGTGNDIEFTSIDSVSHAIFEDGVGAAFADSRIKATIVGFGTGGSTGTAAAIAQASRVDFDMEVQQTAVQGGRGVQVLTGSGNTFYGRVKAAQGIGWDIRCTDSRHYGHANGCTGVGIDVSGARNTFMSNDLSGNSAPFNVDSGVIANTRRIGARKSTTAQSLDVDIDAIGTALTAGLEMLNTTAAGSGAQQYSPAARFSGYGYSNGASRLSDVFVQMRPVQHASASQPAMVLHVVTRVNADNATAKSSAALGSSPDGPTAYGALWLGLGTSVPSTTNWIIESAGADTFYNCPTGSAHKFYINNATGIASFDATGYNLNGATPWARTTYTVTNGTTDRALNVTADTVAQVAAVLGTLIGDLHDSGVLG